MTVLTSQALTVVTLVATLVTGAVAGAPGATPAPGIGESLPCFTVPGCEAFYENLLGAIYAVGHPPHADSKPTFAYLIHAPAFRGGAASTATRSQRKLGYQMPMPSRPASRCREDLFIQILRAFSQGILGVPALWPAK